MSKLPDKPSKGDPIRATDQGLIIDAIGILQAIVGSAPIVVTQSNAGVIISLSQAIPRLDMVSITEKVAKGDKGKARPTIWDSDENVYKEVSSATDPFDIRDTNKPGLGPANVGELWWATIGKSGGWELVNCGCPASTTP